VTKLDYLLIASAVLLLIIVVSRSVTRYVRSSGDVGATVDMAQLIDQLTGSLQRVEDQSRKSGKTPRLVVEKCDVELSFVLKRSASASAQLTAQPVEVGGTTDYSREQVHKLTVHLGPVQDQTGQVGPD